MHRTENPENPARLRGPPPRKNMVLLAEWLRRKIVILVYVGSNPTEHPKSGSRGMVLSRLHRRQEHVGSNPVFPTIRSISIVVITLACHAGDEDSISSCCSTLPFSIKAIMPDSGSGDIRSIRVTATKRWDTQVGEGDGLLNR